MRTDIIRKRDMCPGMCYILGHQYMYASMWFIVSVGQTEVVAFYILYDRSMHRPGKQEIVRWSGLGDEAAIFDGEFIRVH